MLYGLSTIVLPGVHLAFHDDDHDHEGGGIRHLDHDDDHDHDRDHHPHGAGSLVHFATAISDGPAAPLVLVSAPLFAPEPMAPPDEAAVLDRQTESPLARGPPVHSS